MKADSTYWISGTKETSAWSNDLEKTNGCQEQRCFSGIDHRRRYQKAIGENRNQLLGPSVQLGDHTKDVVAYPNHCYISTTIAKELLALRKKNNQRKSQYS